MQSTGLAIEVRKPDQKEPDDQDDEHAALHACASDLLQAIQSNDVKGLASAFKAAFEICEMYPHEEAEHDNDSEEGQE